MTTATQTTTMASGASIWLLPAAADNEFLQRIVAELAQRFGSPLFAPHLTLAGDLHDAPQSYISVLDRLVADGKCVTQPIEDVVLTEAYFRSFYASFARSRALGALKQVCVASVGGSLAGFVPHVSLLYGPVAEPGKSVAGAELRPLLKGRPVTFDRVVVTNSSAAMPVHEWRIHATRTLPS